MFFLLLLCASLVLVDSFALFGGHLKQCPRLSAQEGLDQADFAGSWRLGYLYLDNKEEELEEEHTCVVTELKAVNDTQMNLYLFIDSRKDDHIDRSTAEFPITMLTTGEWALHTPLANTEYIHATVVSHSREHMILTFCGNQASLQNEEIDNNGEPFREDRDTDGYFYRKKRSLADNSFDILVDQPFEERKTLDLSNFHGKIRRYIQESRKGTEGHLWTAILVKHNNVSNLKFVEYASVLMKYGYDVTQGQLAAFGPCNVMHK